MRAYVAGSTSPIQRKPKGSTRFQQIASAMGEQYGVDTSGLKATHHSSFPKKLNAEATIQGNNIHFAPGRDTNYNIRHEVAHAIDNTLNGTPKGDKVVNGQTVDTTRERVVDRMAQKPVNFLTRLKTPGNAGVIGSGSLQAKSIMTDQLPLKSRGISFSTPPVQRFDPSKGKDAQYDMIKDHTSTKDFLAYQENFQQEVMRSPGAYKEQVTTVGFEHEFAALSDKRGHLAREFKGVDHMVLTKSNAPKMAISNLDFILETDSGNHLELISPPFLLQTEAGRPIPQQRLVEDVNRMMMKDLGGLANEKKTLGDLVKKPVGFEKLGIFFDEIKIPDYKATFVSSNTSDFIINEYKSKTIGKEEIAKNIYATPLKKDLFMPPRGDKSVNEPRNPYVHTQINIATDLENAFYLEKSSQDDKEVMENKGNHTVAQNYITQEVIPLLNPSYVDRNMIFFIDELAHVFLTQFAVWPLEDLRRKQKQKFSLLKIENALTKGFDKKQFLAREMETSSVKGLTGIWIKDTIINLGLGLLTVEQWKEVQKLLDKPEFENILKKVSPMQSESNVEWFEDFYKNAFGGKLVYKRLVFKKIKDSKGDSFQLMAGFRKNILIARDTLKKEIKTLLEKHSEHSPVAVQAPPEVDLYEHKSEHHLRARQDTLLDAEKVNNDTMRKIWPGRLLHVAEIRRENINLDAIIAQKEKMRTGGSSTDKKTGLNSPAADEKIELNSSPEQAQKIYNQNIGRYLAIDPIEGERLGLSWNTGSAPASENSKDKYKE